VFRNAGLLEFAARDYDSAMAPLSTALSLNPKTSIVHSTLGDIALLNGKFAEALAEYRREPDSVSRLRGVAIAEMRLSRPGAANAALAELLREHGDVSLYQQAQVLSQWGRRDAALATLEKAVLAGDAGLVRLRNDPMLDPIRNDVRFVAVQRRLGFE
jgi:tetratricopeptide (TPR) repeat protein